MKYEVFEDSDGVNLRIEYNHDCLLFFKSSFYEDWTQKETWIEYRDNNSNPSAIIRYVIRNYDKIYAIWKEETLKRSL